MGMFKVGIRNYQAIKSANLTFVPGLNVIVGESNNGKTAIFRAIETAVFNLSREGHVTLGQTVSAVGVDYNGHEVIWRRDITAASPVTYRIDKKELSKLGRGQPEVVANALGISEVELDDFKMRLNFQKQMSYPFLLDKTPSQLFKFIVQSAEEGRVMDVIGQMKTDLNKSYSDIKTFEGSRETIKEAANREIRKYKAKVVYITTCNKILELDSRVKSYVNLESSVTKIRGSESVKASFGERLGFISGRLTAINTSHEVLDKGLYRLMVLDNSKTSITHLENVNADRRIEMDSLVREISLYNGLAQMSDKLSDIEDIQNKVDSLAKFIESIKSAKDSIKTMKARQSVLADVLSNSNIEGPEKIDRLTGVVRSIISQQHGIDMLKDSTMQVVIYLKAVADEMKEFKVCPFCSSELKGEQ